MADRYGQDSLAPFVEHFDLLVENVGPADTSMSARRLYIYRCGTTNACALTGEKGEPRLPPASARSLAVLDADQPSSDR
jgi:hypothetical protein